MNCWIVSICMVTCLSVMSVLVLVIICWPLITHYINKSRYFQYTVVWISMGIFRIRTFAIFKEMSDKCEQFCSVLLPRSTQASHVDCYACQYTSGHRQTSAGQPQLRRLHFDDEHHLRTSYVVALTFFRRYKRSG